MLLDVSDSSLRVTPADRPAPRQPSSRALRVSVPPLLRVEVFSVSREPSILA